MAGLLKQLQKNKKKIETPPVLRPSEPVVLDTEHIDRRLVEAEKIYTELVKEGGEQTRDATMIMPISGESPPSSLFVMNAEPKAAPQPKKESPDEPDWKVEERALPQQILTLVAQTCTILQEALERPGFARAELESEIKKAVERAAEQVISDARITWKDQDLAVRELVSLLRGRGPLAPLFEDNFVLDIFVDHHASVKVTRKGKLIETPIQFRSAAEYSLYVANLLNESGRQLTFESPILDCILDDRWKSRLSALHGSILGSEEPRISLRIPRQQKASFYDILQSKVLPATLAAWLAEVVAQGEANILIVGPTGTGKTVMTSALLSEVGSDERVTTVEDFPEISVPALNIEKLVARPAGPDGKGALTKSELIQVALRRTSRRIVVSELRDEEARYFLRALENGFTGSIGSIHGEYPEDGLWRLLDLVSGFERSPQQSLVRRISRCFHLVIAMEKIDGKPCLSELAEVYPARGAEFTVQPLVRFEGITDGKRIWKMLVDDSYWIRRIADKGVKLASGPALLPVDKPAQKKEKSDK